MKPRPSDPVRALKALADPTRLRVLAALSREELTVGEVRGVVGAAQSSVSRHLAILRAAGLVRDRKEATCVFFALHDHMPRDTRRLYDAVAARFDRLPGAAADRARLLACRRRRAERSQAYFEAVAGDWEKIRRSFFDDRVTSLAIEKLLPPRLVLADVGCGAGTLAFDLARFAARVHAVDRSRQMLRVARQACRRRGLSNVTFHAGDAEALPLDDGAADAAFCVMVLHVLAQPARAVAELGRITRPGGAVILVDLVPHDQEWMREHMAHRWLGFERAAVETWLREAGATEIDFELTGAFAGRRGKNEGASGAAVAGAVEIFVARGRKPLRSPS
ncbi:MAG: metalloregulator ArsR/SmtB family transcription factor [Planctomycetes bacterium]|nr:metalloregulator ArsR/SmtB family transcription factor [Planctomycetota bacterium]